MSKNRRAVFLKQSGELLERAGASGHWGAADQVAAGIAEAYGKLEELGVQGLTVVPGAGNIARGDNLRANGIATDYADAIGRWGTIGNAMALCGALEAHGVPVQAFITDKMAYGDTRFKFEAYSPEKLASAHQLGKVAVIAGGSGEENVTTDNAVAFYAHDYRQVFDGEIIVLKSTKYDGVYESDPAVNPDNLPLKYTKISARTMREDYEKYKVVDERSLGHLIDEDLSMLIYSEHLHKLSEVLAQPLGSIGTLVVAEACEPVPQV